MITGEHVLKEQKAIDDLIYSNPRSKFHLSRCEKSKQSQTVTPELQRINYKLEQDHGIDNFLSNDETLQSQPVEIDRKLIQHGDANYQSNNNPRSFCRRCGGRMKCMCVAKNKTCSNRNSQGGTRESNLPLLNQRQNYQDISADIKGTGRIGGRDFSDNNSRQSFQTNNEINVTVLNPSAQSGDNSTNNPQMRERLVLDREPMANNAKLNKFLDTQTQSMVSSKYTTRTNTKAQSGGFMNNPSSASYSTTPASQMIVKLDQLYKPKIRNNAGQGVLRNNRLIFDSKEQVVDNNRMLWQKAQARRSDLPSSNMKASLLSRKQGTQSNPASAAPSTQTSNHPSMSQSHTQQQVTPMSIATLPSAQHQEKYANLVKGKQKPSVSPARHLLMQFQANQQRDNREIIKNQIKKIEVKMGEQIDKKRNDEDTVEDDSPIKIHDKHQDQTQTETLKTFDEFLSSLPPNLLDNLNINDSQQLNHLQIQYQCFQMEEQLRRLHSDHDQGLTIEQFDGSKGSRSKAGSIEHKPKDLGTQGDFDKFAKMDIKQKYQVYQNQFEGLNDLGTAPNLNEYTARKIKQQKLQIAQLSYEYAAKLSQMSDMAGKIADENSPGQNIRQQKEAKKKFKLLIEKAQQIQKANQMLQGIEILETGEDAEIIINNNGLPGIPKDGKETSKKGKVGIDYSKIIEEKKNSERMKNRTKFSSILSSQDSTANYEDKEQQKLNDYMSFEQFSGLHGREQYKLVSKQHNFKQTLKMIQLPDSKNLSKTIINVSLTTLHCDTNSRETLDALPLEDARPNLMIVNTMKKNKVQQGKSLGRNNMNLTCGTNLNDDPANLAMKNNNTFQLRESSAHLKPSYSNYKVQQGMSQPNTSPGKSNEHRSSVDTCVNKDKNRSSIGKYKRLKMPCSKTDHYAENDDVNMKQQFINQDLMTEVEFNTIRENFKKLREEIKPSHQKLYSKNFTQDANNAEVKKKQDIQDKQRTKNEQLRAMIANNKGSKGMERVDSKHEMLLTMQTKHHQQQNKQDKSNKNIQRVYHLNGSSVKLSEKSQHVGNRTRGIEKHHSNFNLEQNEFDTNYTSPKNGQMTDGNFSKMQENYPDNDDIYTEHKFQTDRNTSKGQMRHKSNYEDYSDTSVVPNSFFGSRQPQSPRTKPGQTAKTQNSSVNRQFQRIRMPDGGTQDNQENKEKFNLERFQDLKSSQTFNGENGSTGKMLNITFRSNFKNLAERTMGGGFGGYGNTINGTRTGGTQDKNTAYVIGKQIGGLGVNQGAPRSWIGQKYNYRGKYTDIDAFLQDFNLGNPKVEDQSQFASSQDLDPSVDMMINGDGFNTLNVKKMNLNRHQITRFEENKQQFEAILRETMKMQINHQRAKKSQKRRRQALRDSKDSKESRSIKGSLLLDNEADTRIHGYDYDDEQLSSMDDDDRDVSSDSYDNQIHLVTIDGPDPSATGEVKDFNLDMKKVPEKITATPDQKKVIKYFPPRKLPNPFEEAQLEQVRFLQARKDALAKYSEISKNRYKQDETTPLKYVVRPGNNSQLIIRVMEESGRTEAKSDPRDEDSTLFPGWEPSDDQLDSLFNFKWKPTSCGIKFDMISKHGLKQLVNHVQGHQAITTKDKLFQNLKQHYEQQKTQNIYDVVPLTIVLDYMNDNVGEQVHMFVQINKIIDKVSSNTKTNLTLAQEVDSINDKIFKYQQMNQKNLKTQLKITECCHKRQNLWLLKPTGFNQGIGIHIFQNIDQLCEVMAQSYGIGRGGKDKVSIFQPHKSNMLASMMNSTKNQDKFQSQTFVLQKLIERPLLYCGRKFDIRVWVLITSYDCKCYLYKEGYMRTSSKIYKEYDPSVPNDQQIFMQLTNNAIQRHGDEYGKYEEGNILSLKMLFNYISKLPIAKDQTAEYLYDSFQASMIQIIQSSIKSVKGKLNQQGYTFELLGFDFLLDELLNTILIEVNTNPCLEESNKLLKNLLPRMIDDLLNVVSDPIFNQAHIHNHIPSQIGQFPNNQQQSPMKRVAQAKEFYDSNYELPGELFGEGHPGYPDTENLWEHVCTWD